MGKKLLIVESPAKAKTIEKYLGEEYQVKSSFGHVRDLEKGKRGIEIDNNFQPNYIVSPEKHKVVKELKDSARKASEVWLATDEDREGEAIAWHLCEVLDLDPKITKRIVFHEITKPAIQAAVLNPRKVDLDLVNAQQARRVLDRLVGFELSELLWRKIKNNLSAGRVQSVAVKLIVEREREIRNFEVTPFFKVSALFKVQDKEGRNYTIKAERPERFDDMAGARAFLESCKKAAFTIKTIEVKPLRRKPAAPFTTSTLQQEASRKLGFSVSRTMVTAQRLYEQGLITYMRTDSTSLSATAIQQITQEIASSFGSQYVEQRTYKSKTANAQEAHEAIRPSYIDRQEVSSIRDEQRLYELIWKRAIASQMADAELEKTIVKIGISTMPQEYLQAEGEIIKFDGFLKVYLESEDEEEEAHDETILPPLTVGQQLDLRKMEAIQRFTRPPARYTEASLVKKLEELGIGRPSTYAPTISKIMETGRGYVIKELREGTERKFEVLTLEQGVIKQHTDKEITGAAKNNLFPTDMGMLVVDFLNKNFEEIMNYSFTAEIEKKFDVIADGKMEWHQMIDSFYHPFHKKLEDTLQNTGRESGKRILGTDPKSGNTVFVRMARFGPVVQIGDTDEVKEEEKPEFANLKAGQSMENISFEQAMELFKLPKTLGNFEDKEVTIGQGRFGPYVKYDEGFISIPRNEDPLSITMERAIELINDKRTADAPVANYKQMPITKGKGRFGPFLKWNDLYVNVSPKYNFDQLDAKTAIELVVAKEEKEAKRFINNWEEEKISVQNGRWGPTIFFGKKYFNFPKDKEGNRITAEEAANYKLEEVKAIIEANDPKAFTKKTKVTKAKVSTTNAKSTIAKKPAKKVITIKKKVKA
ncbi:MAG: type I DNA topoisomerase [Saprospiraceae bacterium]|nr:type I DNA topoisomerase [Saprospiraceae bacterium]MBP7800568.1 type I DNA topoisomerase [Saprospiraceae bacterium]